MALGVAGKPTVPERPRVEESEPEPLFGKSGDRLLALLLERNRLLNDPPPDEGGLSGRFPPVAETIAAL